MPRVGVDVLSLTPLSACTQKPLSCLCHWNVCAAFFITSMVLCADSPQLTGPGSSWPWSFKYTASSCWAMVCEDNTYGYAFFYNRYFVPETQCLLIHITEESTVTWTCQSHSLFWFWCRMGLFGSVRICHLSSNQNKMLPRHCKILPFIDLS